MFILMLHNIFGLTAEDNAQIIDQLRGDSHIVTKPMDSTAADIVFVYKGIGGYAFLFHGFP